MPSEIVIIYKKSDRFPMNAPAINFNVSVTNSSIENQTLQVSIDPLFDDPDVYGVIRYQWQRSDGQGGWIDISGAASTIYLLGDADVGYEIRVIASQQLAPGVGGYPPWRLLDLARDMDKLTGNVLIATACSCHGVMHGLAQGSGRDRV
jgi:hypothetical protein